MEHYIYDFVRIVLALAGGATIGLTFGLLQQVAQRRYEKRQAEGKLKSGWSVMPGSGRRVAYLLIALALIQFLCPMLFTDGIQWWVSGGLLLGYGWMLLQQLLRRKAASA